ncbi:MAG: hypothetical protein ACLSVD_17235 [Eggerthellaceae bacterium]
MVNAGAILVWRADGWSDAAPTPTVAAGGLYARMWDDYQRRDMAYRGRKGPAMLRESLGLTDAGMRNFKRGCSSARWRTWC